MQAASGHEQMAGRAMHTVHVSADFPDSIQPQKTPVIERLIALAPEPLRHSVYSLNRVAPGVGGTLRSALGGWSGRIVSRPEPFGKAVTYAAPGKGVLHASALRGLGDWLAHDISQGRRANLLFGHKLTVEGLAVRHAARKLGIPYAITIQGNTDLKILRYRPDLRHAIGRVFREAAHVISFAPWSLAEVEDLLGKRDGPSEVIPCPPDFSDVIPPNLQGQGLVSVFHLHNAKGKNLPRMAQAMGMLLAEHPKASLKIVGGGTAQELANSLAMIGGQTNVTLAGPMQRSELRGALNGAAALVLPSLRESFGLVFVEALLSGLPIIYPKGAAIDGYFDGCSFAIGVDARSVEDIAAGMDAALRNSAVLKAELLEWQNSSAAQRFLPETIGGNFSSVIRSAAAASAQ